MRKDKLLMKQLKRKLRTAFFFDNRKFTDISKIKINREKTQELPSNKKNFVLPRSLLDLWVSCRYWLLFPATGTP